MIEERKTLEEKGPTDADIVQRNFGLTVGQDDWLRERAFRDRRAKADIVREAISEYMERHAG